MRFGSQVYCFFPLKEDGAISALPEGYVVFCRVSGLLVAEGHEVLPPLCKWHASIPHRLLAHVACRAIMQPG